MKATATITTAAHTNESIKKEEKKNTIKTNSNKLK